MARSTTRKTSTKAASAGTTTTRSKAVSTRTKAVSTRSKAAPAKKATPNTRKAPAAKPVAEAVPAPTVNAPGGMQPFTSSVTLRKTEFIERVVEATGMKRKDIKPVVEVALKELGNALVKGEDLQLMPMGKVKIHKRKSDGGDDVMLLKFRRGAGSVGAADPLADEEE